MVMDVETRHVKYAFADVVFTIERTVNAQVEIIAELNSAFKNAAGSHEVIFLPTGDGICAAIVEPNAPADAHLKMALRVVEHIYAWPKTALPNRRCTVRFGINESVDCVVTDINNRENRAGAGINEAQRLMSLGDGNQIIVGRRVFESLCVHDEYSDSFRKLRAEVKHGEIITAFQFVKGGIEFLNNDVPDQVGRRSAVEIELNESLSKPENFSTAAQVRCLGKAIEDSETEMSELLSDMTSSRTPSQLVSLQQAQSSWKISYEHDTKWRVALRDTVKGSIFRTLGLDLALRLIRERISLLKLYRSVWLSAAVRPKESSSTSPIS